METIEHTGFTWEKSGCEVGKGKTSWNPWNKVIACLLNLWARACRPVSRETLRSKGNKSPVWEVLPHYTSEYNGLLFSLKRGSSSDTHMTWMGLKDAVITSVCQMWRNRSWVRPVMTRCHLYEGPRSQIHYDRRKTCLLEWEKAEMLVIFRQVQHSTCYHVLGIPIHASLLMNLIPWTTYLKWWGW